MNTKRILGISGAVLGAAILGGCIKPDRVMDFNGILRDIIAYL